MRKLLSVLALFLLILPACAGPAVENPGASITVYTSFYPLYDFAAKVGGNTADVINLAPAGSDPHDWEPTPSDMAGLRQADIFVYNGAGFEPWAADIIKTMPQNKPIIVEAAAGIDLIEDSDGGHGHDGDPHVWLSPVNAQRMIQSICDTMIQADPEHADVYRENASRWIGELKQLDLEFHQALDPMENRSIVVTHAGYGWLCHEYDLVQIAAQGFTSGEEPDPAQVASLIDFIRDNDVRTIFFDEQEGGAVAGMLARETGVRVETLHTLESLTQEQLEAGEDYFSLMRKNLQALVAALS